MKISMSGIIPVVTLAGQPNLCTHHRATSMEDSVDISVITIFGNSSETTALLRRPRQDRKMSGTARNDRLAERFAR